MTENPFYTAFRIAALDAGTPVVVRLRDGGLFQIVERAGPTFSNVRSWNRHTSIPASWLDADVFDAVLTAMRAAGELYVRVIAHADTWQFDTRQEPHSGESGELA